MKSRKVVITLEVETNIPLKVLRDKAEWGLFHKSEAVMNVEQIHVKVKEGK